MKIYLASFLQPENFGPGRKIAIATNKPDNIYVNGAWSQVIPKSEILDRYRELQLQDQSDAADYFKFEYNKQLETFFKEAKEDAEKQGVDVLSLLPLKDGDTLLSWERAENTNYRRILNEHLAKLNVDVILH